MDHRVFNFILLILLFTFGSSISYASGGEIIPRNENCAHPVDVDVSDRTARDEVPVSLQFRDKGATRVACSLVDGQSCKVRSASEIFVIDGTISRNGLNINFSGDITIIGCAQVSLVHMPIGHSQ